MSNTIRVKTTDLKPGMRLAGRRKRTVAGVEKRVVSGGGEFDDYTVWTVVLEELFYAPGRGMIAQWAECAPNELHTVVTA